jgi:hypothetical protein
MNKNRLQNKLTKEILEYEYKTLGSMQKIANKLSVSIDSVYKYMKLYGLSYDKHFTGIYECNENIFDSDNAESFYLAGFIAADGSLQKRQYSKILKICLSNVDLAHLEKIKISFNSNHPIKTYNVKPGKLIKTSHKCVEIQIVSDKIYDDLLRFNIVPNKTFIYMMPEWLVNHPLVHHFMRGYFDGDGSISYCGLSAGRAIKQLHFNILGTQNFIEEYRNILIKNCQLHYNKTVVKNNVFSLSYSGNKVVKKIYDFLYKDATIWLDRKREKFIFHRLGKDDVGF